MTRSCNAMHAHTAARVTKIRKLIAALQVRPLARDEIGAVLEAGPSCVRKYLADLRGKYETDCVMGEEFIRLTINETEAQAYLGTLAKQAPARPAKLRPEPDPTRHFHILADDTHYAIRVNSAPAARDWAVAALFGTRCVELRA